MRKLRIKIFWMSRKENLQLSTCFISIYDKNIFKEVTSLTLETSSITWLYLQKTVKFETETIT